MSDPRSGPLPVTIVIPTVGRPRQLRECLRHLLNCEPPAAEILVVDQSADSSAADVARELESPLVRVLEIGERGIGIATNSGLRVAAHDLVLITHDDCRVASDWVRVGWRRMTEVPGGIVTGRVLPVGDPRMVPSTKTDPVPRDFTGEATWRVLYPNNMAADRRALLALGGFDQRIAPAAEDNDLCYRWLTAGRRLRYAPDMVVWHDDWRSETQLERLHVGYAYGQGMFYAKHLWRGDRRVARAIFDDLRRGVRSSSVGLRRGTSRWRDPGRGILPGLPAGLARGLRVFRPRLRDLEWASGRRPSRTGPLDVEELARRTREKRRRPRPTGADYLHLKHLRDDLRTALADLPLRAPRVLDVFCGSRPYEELLPAGSACVGLDIDDPYGVADVVSSEFLPFEDREFDLVLCTEAFHFVEDPVHGVREIQRVLRPGGWVVLTVPFAWEYDRTILEHRFTEPELRALFAEWEQVDVLENGGRGVVWAAVTGQLGRQIATRAYRLSPLFSLLYASVNCVGAALERVDRWGTRPEMRLPMNLLLTARRPGDGSPD